MKIETGIKVKNSEGIEEEIIIECYLAHYPYEHIVKKVIGQPTKKGKDTKAYRDTRHHLGDDWFSDISDNWFMPGVLTYPQVEKISKMMDELF
jgi:hypothetical protein